MRQSGRSWKSGKKQDLFDMGLSSNSVKISYFENAQSVIDNEEK